MARALGPPELSPPVVARGGTTLGVADVRQGPALRRDRGRGAASFSLVAHKREEGNEREVAALREELAMGVD